MTSINPTVSDTRVQLQRLTTRSAIFTLADFAQLGIGFVLIPLYTTHLTTGDYGTLAVVTTIGSVLAVLYLQCMGGAFTRFTYEIQDDDERRQFYGSVWMFHLAYASLLTLVLEVIGNSTVILNLNGIPYDPYVRLVVWTTLISSLFFLLPRALFLAREQVWRYAALNLGLFLFSTGAVVFFVAYKGGGARGSLMGTLTATVIVGVPAAVVTLRNIRFTWNSTYIRSALAFSTPLVPHLLALWALGLADRLILHLYVPLDVIGVYALGYQIGTVPQLLAFALATALNPFFFATASSRADARSLLGKVTTHYMLVVAWAAMATIVLAPGAISMVAARPGYLEAGTVVPWVAAGSFARGFYFIFLTALSYGKALGKLPVITITAALVNIGLNLILVPIYGHMAAALTMSITFIAQSVWMFFAARRAYPIDYEWRRMTAIGAVAVSWTVILSVFTIPGIWFDLLVKVMLILFFPVILFLLNIFSGDERRQLLAFATRR